jgi:two-component system, chemotaxis family, protein-glutamate methylesterase/glutaminase
MKKIRTLLAEDSPTSRRLLTEMLLADPEFALAGVAHDGIEAVEMTKRLAPDVVVMDIQMPKMNGFDATKQIMIDTPTPVVIVSAAIDPADMAVSMNALRVGALAVLRKPAGPAASGFDREARQFVQTVKAMAEVKVVRHRRPAPVVSANASPSVSAGWPVRAVVMAASTGGPAALHTILSALPAGYKLPIFVVQHIAGGFVEGLASWLDVSSRLSVVVAHEGDDVRPGRVYIAPDNRHLGLAGQGTIRLSDGPLVDGFRPSASFLFREAARAFGSSTLAVVLTGMGSDGVRGLTDVREAGGHIIAQDEQTSVVYGMPAAAVDAGLADASMGIGAIVEKLKEVAA